MNEDMDTAEEDRQLRHDQAKVVIMRDYLGPEPLFDEKDFKRSFKISKPRFLKMLDDFAKSGDPFYRIGNEGSSLEAKLMLPLKCLAFGLPHHCISDYFQMSMTDAEDCCEKFDAKIKEIYGAESSI